MKLKLSNVKICNPEIQNAVGFRENSTMKLLQLDTPGDGSCFTHSLVRNMNPEIKGTEAGLCLREILAMFCLPRGNCDLKRLKQFIRALESICSRTQYGFRRCFNSLLRKELEEGMSIYDQVWESLGDFPVPTAKDTYETLHVKKKQKSFPWMDIFHIMYCAKVMNLNILFVNNSKECWMQCDQSDKSSNSCDRKCKKPNLYCGVSNYDSKSKQETTIIHWLGNSHFESAFVRQKNGKMRSFWNYKHPFAEHLMRLMDSRCDNVTLEERIRS